MADTNVGAVIITGGSRGLGKELACQAIRSGYSVLITGRDAARLDATGAELRELAARLASPVRVLAVQADVRNEQECERVVLQTMERFGAIHTLVNNAGVGTLSANPERRKIPFWESSVELWKTIMDSNALGPFLMTRAAVPHMLNSGTGRRLINISTSRSTMLLIPSYGASKAALEVMTRSLARELADTPITANVLLPGGGTDTDFFPGEGGPDRWPGISLLPVTIMNEAFTWLLSDASAGISGRSLVGKLWDETLPPAEAARLAMREIADEPMII